MEPGTTTGRGHRVAVRLYWADLDLPPCPFEALKECLAPGELARAARYAHADLRRRWITARGALRHCLASWTGADPRALTLDASPRGKLRLAGGPAFNLSHSGRHLLIAMAPAGRVGVDVEARAVADPEPLVRQACSRREAEAICALPDTAPERPRTTAFIRTWVRKEALVKAFGAGVTVPLAAFEVRHDTGQGNLLRSVKWPGEQLAQWQVRALAAPPGMEAAVAWDTPEFEPGVVPWPT